MTFSSPAVALFALPWTAAVVLGLLFVGSAVDAARRDGRSIVGLVSLVLGLAIVIATVLAIAAVVSDRAVPPAVAVVLLLPGYPALALVSYLIYCLVHLRARPRPAPVAVVVLGSGLVEGTVPTLLADRLRAAMKVWRADATPAASRSSSRAAARATTSRWPRESR